MQGMQNKDDYVFICRICNFQLTGTPGDYQLMHEDLRSFERDTPNHILYSICLDNTFPSIQAICQNETCETRKVNKNATTEIKYIRNKNLKNTYVCCSCKHYWN